LQWGALAAFGMLQMGAPYFLFARGLRTISGHEAAGIGLLEPILVPIWVWLIWSSQPGYEAPRWWTFVGAAFILSGLVLRYSLSAKKEEEVPIAEAAVVSIPEDLATKKAGAELVG
jgi:drug/metabolite transporter (DMT)-like permease